MEKRDYDAVVVGSGPNGLAAAIVMQQAGLSVLLLEAKDTIGGGMRTAEFTLPGFLHDICSAIHPLAAASPFFATLPLEKYGLEYVHPEVIAAHPLDNGRAVALKMSMPQTAAQLGADEATYRKLMEWMVGNWSELLPEILAPAHVPSHPTKLAQFGLLAVRSAARFAQRFHTEEVRALWAGMAAHGMQPLTNAATSAIALVLMTAGHTTGWPIPKGGSASIAKALASLFTALGGKIETDYYVHSLKELPSSHAVLFDVTPKQLLEIAGHRFSSLYRWQLEKYRYGMGVFKIDWALDGPIPFIAESCRQAGTIHLGNTLDEIRRSEQLVWDGGMPEKPFVLLAQQSLFDDTRAPAGKHTGWAYCHVLAGSTVDMTDVIEKQVERSAPGFRERILARHVMNARDMEHYNPNYVGGDINGGVIDIGQLFTRPALRWSPYRTSLKGLYMCSSSTPPGGGVHGMCGYHAAKRALKDVFNLRLPGQKQGTEP